MTCNIGDIVLVSNFKYSDGSDGSLHEPTPCQPYHRNRIGYLCILTEPDNIIPFVYRGEDYFFRYYLSTPEFSDVLSANIDLSSSFMLAEVIELFDIQVYR